MKAAEEDKHPRKARRISRACDYCHHRSIRCRPSPEGEGGRCQNCVDFEQPCTYDRPVKRRGAKVRLRSASATTRDGTQHAPPSSTGSWGSITANNAQVTSPVDPKPLLNQLNINGNGSNEWRAPLVASQAVVMDLVEIYFEVIYPIFPLFHRPTFLRSVSRGEFCADRFLFAAVMAVCALASARARDGSLFSGRWNLAQLRDPPSETFYQAARDAIPINLVTARDHNCMRACAMLAITDIQCGQIRLFHQNLARYHAIVAMDGLHNEANWPKDIGLVELEERRRLFWSVYTLDVYSSVVWSGIIRYREAQCDVQYPTETDDELFDDSGFTHSSETTPPVIGLSPSRLNETICVNSWLCGWNFTTDLYRILEHAMDIFRTRRARLHKQTFLSRIFGDRNQVSQSSVCDQVMDMYHKLPQRFKETPPITFNMREDRFGFQSANIIATVQLLRMVLFAARGASVGERCEIAREVVDAFITIPVAYLNAISSPLLHHLAGIGSILGSVFEEPLTDPEYLQVRSVLLTMAQLLANLDIGLHSTAGASDRLKAHVARIDEYMSSRRAAIAAEEPEAMHFSQDVRRDSLSDSYDAHKMQPDTSGAAEVFAKTQKSQFQVPPELLEEWPWVFDFTLPMERSEVKNGTSYAYYDES